jgi:hypothetical protein
MQYPMRDPSNPRRILTKTWNGAILVRNEQDCDTATLTEVSRNEQRDIQAASAGGGLGDRATLSDFWASGLARTTEVFDQWLQSNGVGSQRSISLKVQAAMRGLDLTASMPNPAEATRIPGDNPVTRQGEPLDDNPDIPVIADLDQVVMPAGATLRQLRQAGVVKEGMSQEEFDARLKRVGLTLHGRMIRTMEAESLGWFKAQTERGLYLPPIPPVGNGDAPLGPGFGHTVSVLPEQDNARSKICNTLQDNLDQLEKILARPMKRPSIAENNSRIGRREVKASAEDILREVNAAITELVKRYSKGKTIELTGRAEKVGTLTLRADSFELR